MEPLKLWEPVHSLLTSAEASTEVKVQALWVIGTAVQNNPQAQDAVRPSLALLSPPPLIA